MRMPLENNGVNETGKNQKRLWQKCLRNRASIILKKTILSKQFCLSRCVKTARHRNSPRGLELVERMRVRALTF